ncbi:hypothetical protein QO003_001367 [Arthrobacter silviterrae]|uniref:Glycosyltransferase RgtA/B/C/D-like domain-containing protein n=1 Tax=Arthrobacter silviterrae TaxID=2026658 RepID=A0ABX0DAD1_9MICC|nr:DUF6541 family protein [Arthrobacter silviterrae]MDQ0277064.1 hypothetical protein [Arthrobacter silviterrae]NGN83877.1 hypothetical protein [Arthrobacter silviterrae]
MTWFQTIPTIIVAGLVVFVPGALLSRLLGARGLAWAATAAPLTVSLAAVGAIAAQKLHVGWSLLPFLGITLLACAVTVAIRLPGIMRRRNTAQGRPPWIRPSWTLVLAVAAGFAVPAIILFVRFAKIFNTPENISQTYDNVFHLNAIRFILNTGNASSLTLGNLSATGTASFYPAAWHDLAALVVGLTGTPIPVGVNALNMVLGALVWTTSSMYLATRLLGNRPAAYLATGALAAGFNAFPYLLMEFGVLYPNFLAIALLPAFMGLAADLMKLSKAPGPNTLLAIILLGVGAPGLALSHPSVVMALGAFAISPLVVWLIVTIRKAFANRIKWRWAAAAGVFTFLYALGLFFLWGVIRPSKTASFWPPLQTVPRAIGEALTNGVLGRPMPWLAALLMVIGIYAVFRRKQGFWVLGGYGLSALFFVVASAFEQNGLRDFLTRVWYNDSNRLASMLPVFALPLAAMGAVWLFDLVVADSRAQPVKAKPNSLASFLRSRNGGLVFGAVAWLAVIVLAQGFAIATAQGKARIQYDLSPASRLLTVDENAILMRLDAHVPSHGIIIDNAGTGSALAYALANRQVILPAIGPNPSRDDSTLIRFLPELGNNPAVCDAIKRLNSYYVLDFGAQEINGMTHPFPSSKALAEMPGLKLLDQEGTAKLYQVTGCR